MKILHFCAGLQGWNGMANTARQFVAEEIAAGHDSTLTCNVEDVAGKVDVVHIHGAWLPAVHRAARRAKSIGAKLIVRPAGSYDPVRRRFHGWKKWLMAPWEHAMLRRADVVQATCPQEVEWIRAYHPGSTVELTDLKRFFDVSSSEKFRFEKDRMRPLHVLYLGRRHPLKGVEFLERAVAELNGEADSCPLQDKDGRILTSGEDAASPFGSGRDSASPLVELRVESAVFGEEKEKTWEWCDVLCLPTLSENFGRVVAEALEHGKRVITTDGAPAWDPSEKVKGEGQGQQWRDRVSYLRGYRDGTDEERVKLLKDALLAEVRAESLV